MLAPFVHESVPQRVVFGSGTLDALPAELERLGVSRVLVLCTPAQTALAERVTSRIKARSAAVFAGARMHTPVEVTDEAMVVVERERVDGTIAVGGGSTTGLGKAIAYRTDLPQIVVPTTYAGSEMTNILGETAGGAKTTRRDPRILPEVIVYDVDLTLTLPPRVSVASGMNAIAHAVEGLYARDRTPVTSLLAEEGIRALRSSLTDVARRPSDKDARSRALYGAWLCGSVLGATTMALHHQVCHVLGGLFELPHAETHASVLPHAAAFNASGAPDAMSRIRLALGSDSAAAGLFDLAAHNGAPVALREIGMPESGLDQAADAVAARPYWNPQTVTRDAVRQLLDDAWHGRRPK